MTRRRQLSHDCCIDLSPKVFVRRTSLTQIQMMSKGVKKESGKEGEGAGKSEETKDEEQGSKFVANPNGEELNPIEHLTPSQFNDANEIRRAISLNNIWKVSVRVRFNQ